MTMNHMLSYFAQFSWCPPLDPYTEKVKAYGA